MNKRFLVKIVPLLIICILMACFSFALPDSSFQLTGKLESRNIKTVTLSYRDAEGRTIAITDSSFNGVFRFSGSIEEPTSAKLSCNISTGKSNDNNCINIFFIEPAQMKMDVKEGHFSEFRLTGSKTQSVYDSLEKAKAAIYKSIAPLDGQLDLLNDSLRKALKVKDSVRIYEIMAGRKSVFSQIKPHSDTINEINIQFADRHPDSYISAFLLMDALRSQSPDLNRIKVCFIKLSPVVQNSNYGRDIQLRLGINKVLPTGAVFPDMDGTDIAGNKIFIHDSIVQPYTLVIFWASWCAPCRKHIPEYKEIYKQYQSRGLQIMAITSDADKNAWVGAIQKSTIQNWLHISPGNYEKLWDLCGITSIPAEILLKGSKVIAKFEGADGNHAGIQALNAKLKEVFESAN